ncbi:pseudouridine synthase [Hymenobacter busanensis]|uniref:Pseudouridine synthase n=2 Tax=Hymenobacter busanensis TaxID=2607656 RepID=A0A7L5A3E7_9BACT|nr:pseudouridine synthase [Hymenobacter busanensis]KAA9333495.1 pseudouridine synthase [Hymenobacter busanensis]QHJ08390.1 pseudouridine synthase [Hymenobacter busanensis]
MGKKQHPSGSGNRRPDSAPQRGGKSSFGGDDRRPAPRREGGNNDFNSRPSFGRPGGKPAFGSRPEGSERRFGNGGGDDRRFGNSSAPRPFGGNSRFGGNDDRSFGRPQRPFKPKPAERDDADEFIRGRFNKPPRPAAPEGEAPRRFSSRPDGDNRDRRPAGRSSFGEERRSFGPPRDNRFGEERRSFGAPRDDEFGDRPKQLKGGDDRPVRPARYVDRRDQGFDRGDAPQRFERDDRTPGAFGRRDNDRPNSSGTRGAGRFERDERPSRTERPAFGRDTDRNSSASRFSGDRAERNDRGSRPERPGFERRERPAKPFADRRERPARTESMGEAPSYHNLKHYEEDKTRGNKRRRDEPEGDGSVRLNRYIANAGICSRREADVLIESGEIRVNGEVVTELGYKVQPNDTVHYGKTNLKREKLVYVLLNKPKDFLTTTDDPEGRKTVMDLVRTASKERIFPVGRLDRNTTGLLLFTNDGEVAQKLSHPSHRNKKIYQVELDKPITEEHLKQIAEGIELEDGKAEVDDVAAVAGNLHFVGIEIHIGRNRIVRRIFEHLGYDVKTLDRVQYAGLTKKDLARGNWRYLTEKEVIRLKYFM